jgi:signal transduction histidine kinase
VVRDNGQGMSEDEVEKVFNAFERSGDPMTSREVGTGLGLTLAKKLTELNEGQISIQSVVGQGTSVSLEFPAT